VSTQAPTAPSAFVLNRLPQDDDELWWTIFALWGYRIPRHKVCPHHCAPFDALADAFFARSAMSIWKGSRGLAGKSRTLAMLGITEATLLGCEVSILGGSFSQSLNVHAATQTAWGWHAAPRHLLAKDPTRIDTVLTNGGSLRTLTASQNSVRGPHPPRLRMDEIDEMDQGVLDAALGQPMVQTNYLGQLVQTQTVMSSTHQYPDRTMSEMLKRAKDAGWPVFEWCYRDTSNPYDGWLTKESIARQKEIIPHHMWLTEFDLQEPSFEGRAIDSDLVDAAFDPQLGSFDGHKPIWSEPDKEDTGPHYVTAVDWAKKRDQTIVATFDTRQRPWVCVAWQKMNRQPWPMMVSKALTQWRKYPGKMVHDATGVGDVVDDLIKAEVSLAESKQVHPYIMGAGRQREALFNEYVSAIEQGDIKYPRIDYAWQEHRYCTIEDLYGRGHPPDSLIAGALAWSVRKRSLIVPTMVPGGTRAASPWSI
jgi:hypothetical protein